MEQPLFEVLDNETIQKWLEYRADGSLPASPESVEYFLFQQAVKLTDTLVGYTRSVQDENRMKSKTHYFIRP